MSTPENKFPIQHESGDPKVNGTEQEVITNSEESEKTVNKDGAVADMDGITEDISGSAPDTTLNSDKGVTNTETDNNAI